MRKVTMTLGVVAFGLFLSSGSAWATACAGAAPFTDVAPGDIFCTDVEWLKNRSITLGCTSPTLYCPNDVVTRGTMALFMQRLGTLLTPTIVYGSGFPNDPNAIPNYACQSSALAVANFPRSAKIQAWLWTHDAPATKEVRASIVYSTDGGTTWIDAGGFFRRDTVTAGENSNMSIYASIDLDTINNYKFGVSVTDVVTPAVLAFIDCEVVATVISRTGASSPFDPN